MNVDDGQASAANGYLREERRRVDAAAAGAELAARRVFVAGAGTMGAGIALAALNAGFDVTLLDRSAEVREKADGWLRSELAKALARGHIDADRRAERLAALEICGDFEAAGSADIVIEAVFESMEVKRQVFEQLDSVCKPGCILGTNTSTLDIDRIAEVTRRPSQVVGLHFFAPAHVMPVLEIVKGRLTAPAVVAQAQALAGRLGKAGIIVGNCYGFAGNRMIEGVYREIDLMLLEGAEPEQIDATLEAFGMAMGPCAVLDLVGLDVPYKARRENSQAAPDDTDYYAFCDALVAAGRLGQKSGKGLYRYERGQRTRIPDPQVRSMAAAEADRRHIRQRPIGGDEILDRCLLPWISEAARLLEEGIAHHSGDIDLLSVLGYGFPASRGGPLYYANGQGAANIVSRMAELAELRPTYWQVPALLARTATAGAALVGIARS